MRKWFGLESGVEEILGEVLVSCTGGREGSSRDVMEKVLGRGDLTGEGWVTLLLVKCTDGGVPACEEIPSWVFDDFNRNGSNCLPPFTSPDFQLCGPSRTGVTHEVGKNI